MQEKNACDQDFFEARAKNLLSSFPRANRLPAATAC